MKTSKWPNLVRDEKTLTEQIDALLPQTHCGQCSYAGCLPYAQAIAKRAAEINRCPPGGVNTLKALANLLGKDAEPYVAKMILQEKSPMTAFIRESECIGCTKCIQACPVDAIIGAAKQLHTVLIKECTGCGLCLAPCPVDCIDLIELDLPSYQPQQARKRFHTKQQRLEKKRIETIPIEQTQQPSEQKAYIQAAIIRAKSKKKPLQYQNRSRVKPQLT